MTTSKGTWKGTVIEWIPLKNLCVVWAESQRPYKKKHAQNIADAFDPDMMDPVKVTLPNGEGIYHIVDGQHRVGGLKIYGGENQSIPCIVLPESDPARAAKLFLNINTTRLRPHPIDVFKVSVTAEDETAVAVNNLVKRAGYQVANGQHGNHIMAVAALEAVYRRCGPKVLSDVLVVVQGTWGMDPNAVVAPIIRGYGAFMVEFGSQANWGHLKDCIKKKYTPGRFIGAAKTAREMTGGDTTEAVKMLLVSNYNRGYPDAKRLKSKKA